MPDWSAIGGILDLKGGLRIVIANPLTFYCHVLPGERLFILPVLRVQEPLSIGQFAALGIEARVTAHIKRMVGETVS